MIRLTLFLLLGFIFSSFGQNPKGTPKTNILLIIADDMSLNAGAYGDKTISTPGIDSLAKDGVLFKHAYCTASSCTPSRASILTGRYPHQLAEGGNLWGTLPVSYPTYTKILADNGYRIGLYGKGWGPGDFKVGGYKENPAGPEYKSFKEFIGGLKEDQPFCFWLGSLDPHRPYSPELKTTVKFDQRALKVPSWLPDNELVRNDLKDYYAEVKRFDQTVQEAIIFLKEKGLYDNTLIIVTSDNGRPFPRVKANNYDASTNIPLVMRWGKNFKNGKILKEFVSLMDLAPTILEATRLKIPEQMTAMSLLPLLTNGKKDVRFNSVFTERERHAKVRANNVGYPIRALRTKDYLYINNLIPERWPAGDPDNKETTGAYGDIDNGPTKQFMLLHKDDPALKKYLEWSIFKRPAIELYDLKKDPDQLNNLATDPKYAKIKVTLNKQLMDWRIKTSDPLLNVKTDVFDTHPYYGGKKGN